MMIRQRFRENYKLQNILFDIMWILFLSCRIFDNSAWGALNYLQYFNFFRILKYVLAVLCVSVIMIKLIQREYTWKAVCAYVLLGIIIALSAYFSHNHTFIWYFLMFAAAYRQDAKRVIFLSACVIAIMLVFIVGTSLAGIGIDYIFNDYGRGRHGLGFGWTTTGPVLFLFFILQYVFLRESRMKWFEYVVLEAIAAFFFIMTDTNLTFYCSTAILLFMFVESWMKNRWRFWSRLKWFWILLPVMICILSLVLFVLYDPDSGTWFNLNEFTHGRLTHGQDGILKYGFRLLGQPIEWHGFYITALDVPDYNYIDCSYLQLLLEFGILFLAAVVGIYTAAMYKAVKADNYYLVFILAAVLLFSVMEPRLMELIYNVFPMMAFLALAEKDAPEKTVRASQSSDGISDR